ncbi:polysaccharide pyruvyl transferase CsaB [Fenollaria timonensis]|uniref:polysaccharide pyruvyl transferase CsaB n=1 Tax=Fenollaria timonensis TaxID=1723384 RepID=UPI000A6F793A|nr:polysaccharide pyruvyl transferase CsaB [Fenollaria timonensis]
MKVLHLISGGDTGGAKTHIINLLCGLKDKVEVKLVCFIYGPFAEDLKKHGIDVEVIEQRSRFDFSVVNKLKDLIESENYEIVHSHGARANLISYFLKKKVNAKFITTVHSDYLLDFKDNFYKNIVFTNLNKFALKRFDNYIAVSDSFKDMLVSRGFDKNKIFTIYNGIFLEDRDIKDKESYLKEKNIAYKDKFIVGILARLDKVKDHETFLRAAREVIDKDKSVIFLIAGDGQDKEHLLSLSKELALEDNVYFLGNEEHPYDFLNAIDINVLCSLSESFPYVIMEGGSLKKATIASKVGGIPKIILDGETGKLFEKQDYKALAAHILDLKNNADERKKLGENLYNRIIDNFTHIKMAEKHVDIYKKIVSKKIIMSGYFGFSNSGDDAILKSIIESFKSLDPYLNIKVLSKDPDLTEREYGVAAVDRFKFFDVRKSLKAADMLISGGGSLLQDKTSSRSIWYYLLIMKLAKRYKKKVFVYSNGVGPINKRFNRNITRRVLNKVDYITLRDKDSYDFIKSIGVNNPNIKVLSDPVFNLKEASDESVHKKFDINEDTVLVSIRSWMDDEKLIAELSKFLNYLIDEGKNIVFMPMQTPRDTTISEKIAANLKSSKIINEKYPVEILMSLMKNADFIVAMRLHAMIYAIHQNVPFIGLSYDPKTETLLKDFDESINIDVDAINYDDLLKAYKYIKENREAFISNLSTINEENKKKAIEASKLALKLLEDDANGH